MYSSVLEAFRKSLGNEGYTRWMYLDNRGLVTTGQGDLIDPIGEALGLPWQETDGTLATQTRIQQAWQQVKAHQELKELGGGSVAFQRLTAIRLSDDGITQLVTKVMNGMIEVLENKYLTLCTSPADCQLAVLRWAWANGPHAAYPAMFKAIEDGNYIEAGKQSEWSNENREVKDLLTQLFANAQTVSDTGADPSVLVWTA